MFFLCTPPEWRRIKVQDLPREVQQQLGYLPPGRFRKKAGEVAARGLTGAGGAGRWEAIEHGQSCALDEGKWCED